MKPVKRRLVAGALAGLALSAVGRAAPFPVEVIEQFDEARVVAFIPEARIQASPAWDPLSAPPPLSVAEAVAAVKRERAAKRGGEPFSVMEIELRRLAPHRHRWHYLVKTRDREGVHYYVVLMDGSVVDAIREPESVK